jgi:4-hydroxybenzoate polyprenyltransferase
MSVIPATLSGSKLKLIQYLVTIVTQCLFYLFVVILCLLAGFIANPHTGAADVNSLLDKLFHALDGQDTYSAALASALFFICYFIARLILIDRSPSELNDSAITASLICAGIFYFFFLVVSLVCYQHGIFRTFPLIFFITLPSVVIFFRSVRPQRDPKHPHAHNFLPKTFFPAFSVCYLCFCLGWSWADPTGDKVWLDLNASELIYCTLSFMLMGMFLYSYSDSANTPKVVAIVFTILLFSTLLASIFFYNYVGLALFIALLWSFALGVAEVAKRGHLIESGEVIAGDGETPQFFVAGANWSSILFFNLLLLMPILIANTAMLFVVGIAWILLLAWHLIPNKTSALAYYVALVMGYVLPISMIVLFLVGNVPIVKLPLPATTAHQTDRLVTLLGIFLTIIFVLYHDRYRKMPDELRASFDWFLSKQGCLLFAALTVAVQAAFLTMIFAVLSVSEGSEEKLGQIQVQVDWILIALIVELVFILVFLFIAKDEGKEHPASDCVEQPLLIAPRAGTLEAKLPTVAGTPGSATSIATSRDLLTLASGLLHPFNSSIAGLLSLVLALQRPDGTPLFALQVFASVTALCMFGYVANDICDVRKDQLAHRDDKPIISGLISLSGAIKLAIVLAVISLLASVNADTEVTIVVIAGLLLCSGYSYFSRGLPKLKGLYTGLLCCIPVVAGAGLISTILHLSFLFLIVAFIFGREVVIDVTDMGYDQSSHHNTIALALGPNRALVIGWTAMLSSAPFIYLVQTSTMGRILALSAIISLLGILLFGARDVERSVSLSRIPMLLTIGSFLFLT